MTSTTIAFLIGLSLSQEKAVKCPTPILGDEPLTTAGAQEVENNGLKLIRSDKFPQAVTELRRCTANPQTARNCYRLTAIAYAKMQDDAHAKACYEKMKRSKRPAPSAAMNDECIHEACRHVPSEH